MDSLIIILVFAALIIITIGMGIRIVPQGSKHVVQRLGKYHKTLSPGLNIIIPYIDTVAYKVTTKDIQVDVAPQECITKDNAVITTNAIGFINIISPEKSVYGIEDFHTAIGALIQTSLRSIIGEMSLDSALSGRDHIKTKLKQAISDDIADWGITLKTVEVQDVNPSVTMAKAMEAQAAAERERRATVTAAEGEKSAAILEAEGRLEAAERDAKAKIVQAEASQQSIEMVAKAAQHGDLSIHYLLGEKYVQAIQQAATSNNSKTIILPADLPAAIKGLFGGLGK